MESKQSKGGAARAERLTPHERSDIARAGGHARWEKEREEGGKPRATHKGNVKLGEASIPCAVLDDGRRILSEFGITQALGSRSGASKRIKRASSGDGALIPIFLAPKNLSPFISKELLDGPLSPISYRDGRRVLVGYEARALTKVCNIWLDARDAQALQTQQLERARRAEILIRALADVAINSLVDEATGFQDEREKDALQSLLSLYLSEEKLAWAERFPKEYYRQLYRLRGWSWPVGAAKSPLVGKLTNKLVYDRLPDGVLDELRHRNPTQPGTGRRRWKHHQFLSEDIGQPDLRDHLLQLVAIMRISPDWDAFLRHFEAAFPISGTQISFELNEST